jgi:dolichol-phosphate mannosyltransferase
VELTYRAARAGFRIDEVPIQFRERRAGNSKMNAVIVLEAAIGVPRMRLRRQ